ncbi:hypothetical protein LJC40_07210, partial [Synergistaceae bacterium OttesenSCG-928-D05]|nr:hypothetical protein [Synergistaceae bacterium OttesenSCG-928-D05]
ALTPNADGVYEIGTAAQLIEFGAGINDGSIARDSNAKLTANIDLSGVDWKPIGQHILIADIYGKNPGNNLQEDLSYNGTFDGAGFRILALTVNAANAVRYCYPASDTEWVSEQAVGLFGVLGSNAMLKNLTLTGINILGDIDAASVMHAAAVAGGNYGTIQNLRVETGAVQGVFAGGMVSRNGGVVADSSVSGLQVVSNSSNAGGLVCRNEPTGQIIACAVQRVRVDGLHFVGGIVGGSDADGEIIGCTVSGSMTSIISRGGVSNSRAGGIVGSNAGAVIENCLVQDILSVSGYYAGGIAGRSNANVITGCVVAGIGVITAECYGGGIVGSLAGADISNCIASNIGEITGSETESGAGAGGIVGRLASGTVVNCAAYDIDLIKGNSAGGVIGWFHNAAGNQMQNCVAFGIGQIVGAENSFGGVIGTLNSSNETAADSRYAYGIVSPDRGTGNVAKRPGTNITSFDATDDADTLDAYVVALDQGTSHTMTVGETYELDITGLPGMVGLDSDAITWGTEELGFISVVPSADGLKVTVTAVAAGTEKVTCAVETDLLAAELSCSIKVVEEGASSVDGTVTGDPADGLIVPGTDVNLTYDFSPYTAIAVDNTGMQTDVSGLIADIMNGKVVVTGVAKAAGNYFYVVTLQRPDGSTFDQTVYVTVQGGSTPTGTGSGGSSNCNTGVGAALFALLGLALIQKRK